MSKLYLFIILLPVYQLFSQNSIDINSIESKMIDLGVVVNNNKDFSSFKQLDPLLKDVEIVMLGEQSHGEGTAYESKIKLIKYLHQNLGYDLLVFESGFYDSKKAWDLIEDNNDISLSLANSITYLWATTKEFRHLVNYTEALKNSDNPLKILGFDSHFTGVISKEYYLKDLSSFLDKIDPSIRESKEWFHLETSLNLAFDFELKKLKKRTISLDTIFLNKTIKKITQFSNDKNSSFWIQNLKSTKVGLSDLAFDTDHRDRQMANNLIWIKKQYPNKKIICWGATSHFLYNSKNIEMKSPIVRTLGGNYYKRHKMMGDYIKTKYEEKLFTIGFTAYEGRYGLQTRNKKLKKAKSNTLEFLLNKSKYDNFLLPLNQLDFQNLPSRPLGNYYMKNNISDVMDAVIFNRNMERPEFDVNLFIKAYPKNKNFDPELENENSETINNRRVITTGELKN